MLSIGMLGAGEENYYLAIAAGAGPSRADEYYTARGESAGVWLGGGAADLGLAGPVDPPVLRSVLAGIDPATGESLVSALAANRRARAGLYLTFSAPKGVSILGLVNDGPVAEAVLAAHDGAVADVLAHLEGSALFVRRGRDGLRRLPTGGFVAAAFRHSTSRAGDPQLHTHVLAANLARGLDGRWSAPDSRSLFRYARTAGFLYQAALRARLTETLGIEWGPVRRGMAEPIGIPPEVLREFSTRRRQIEAHLEQRGLDGARAAQVAATATRQAKDHEVTAGVLRDSWRLQSASLGFAPDRMDGLLGPARSPIGLADALDSRLIDELSGPGGLTAERTSFDRRDVLRAVAAAASDGATPAEVEAAADRVLTDPRVVLRPDSDGFAEGRWTTTDLLAVEADVLALAERRRHAGVAVAGAAQIVGATDARPTLSDEQRAAVVRLVGDGDGVAVLVGRAGTGKTFALDAARAAWQDSGIAVVGAAPSARAAAELQAGSGIPSVTLARLMMDAEAKGPYGGLPRGGVVVVDEAGMAGTRTLHRLLSIAERSGTKVVLVGDPAQLPEIDAGGSFRALAARLDAPELVSNRRQVEVWEREALDRLRSGQAGPAVALYREHGRIVVGDSALDVRASLVGDWWTARRDGTDAGMYALARADVDALNRLAREMMGDAGRLGPDQLSAGGRDFAVGDEVVALRNDRRVGVVNGTRGVVTALDLANRGLTVATPDGRSVELPEQYLAAGHVDHGYALTLHKAQGATVDRAFLLGSDTIFREAGYVGMSRGRRSNDLYLVAGDEPELIDHGIRRAAARDAHDELADRLTRSRAQRLATVEGVAPVDLRRSLRDLHAERDAIGRGLVERFPIQTPSTGERGPADAGRINEAMRYQAVTAAIEQRSALLGRAALAEPTPYVTAELGQPPAFGIARAQWRAAATAIEVYREQYGVAGQDTALGAAPEEPLRRMSWDRVSRLVDQATPQRTVERDRGWGLDR